MGFNVKTVVKYLVNTTWNTLVNTELRMVNKTFNTGRYLTFRGPCVVIYILIINQRDALISQIYFGNGTLHISDSFSVHHQESSTIHNSNRYMSYRLCWLLANGIRMELQFHSDPASKLSALPVWHIPIDVCTVPDSYWWTEKLYEICRVLFQK